MPPRKAGKEILGIPVLYFGIFFNLLSKLADFLVTRYLLVEVYDRSIFEFTSANSDKCLKHSLSIVVPARFSASLGKRAGQLT